MGSGGMSVDEQLSLEMWGGGGVDWVGMMSSILEGAVLLSSLVGAVALVVLARRPRR